MRILSKLFSKKQEIQETEKSEVETESKEVEPIEQAKPKNVIKTQKFRLDNLEEHMKDVMEIVDKNEDYKLSKKALIEDCRDDEKIFEYELLATPTFCIGGGGEIQVLVHNVHIGDIKQGRSTERIKKLIESENIKDATARVSGGQYKILRYDGNRYYLDDYETEFSITVEISYKSLSGKK